MSGATMVVVVTGANRGIGRAICDLVLQSQNSVKLYAASRSGADLGIKTSNGATVVYPTLDVTKDQTIQQLADTIKGDDGKVDVLINNAGVNTHPDSSPAGVGQMLDVNYRGTLRMCQTFIPLLSKNGRIVNISSVGSSLHIYSKEVQARFRNSNMKLDDIEKIAQDYMQAVEGGKEADSGFGGNGQGYSVSKACVNAVTAVLAREHSGLTINACCPGWVATDMGSIMGQPPKKPVEGAKIPVKLGFGDIKGTTGRYWANPNISDTADGQVMTW